MQRGGQTGGQMRGEAPGSLPLFEEQHLEPLRALANAKPEAPLLLNSSLDPARVEEVLVGLARKITSAKAAAYIAYGRGGRGEIIVGHVTEHAPDGINILRHIAGTPSPFADELGGGGYAALGEAGLVRLAAVGAVDRGAVESLGVRDAAVVRLSTAETPLGELVVFTDSPAGDREGVLTGLALQAAHPMSNAIRHRTLDDTSVAVEQFLRTFAHDIRNKMTAVERLPTTNQELITNALLIIGHEDSEGMVQQLITSRVINKERADEMRAEAARLKDADGVDRLARVGELLASIYRNDGSVNTAMVEAEVMLNQTLDRARVRTGRQEYNPRPVDFGEVVRNEFERQSNSPYADGVTMSLEIEEGLPHVNADPRFVSTIPENLISNALKYTPADCPERRVTVRLHRTEEGKVRLEVTDTGRGIKRQDWDRVWLPGGRASTAEGIEGTGFGLAYAKQVAEEGFQGRLWGASDGPGRGTTFACDLNAAEERVIMIVKDTASENRYVLYTSDAEYRDKGEAPIPQDMTVGVTYSHTFTDWRNPLIIPTLQERTRAAHGDEAAGEGGATIRDVRDMLARRVNDMISRLGSRSLVFLDVDLEQFRKALLDLTRGVPRVTIDEDLRTNGLMVSVGRADRDWYMRRVDEVVREQGIDEEKVRPWVAEGGGTETQLAELLLKVDPKIEGLPENIQTAANTAQRYSRADAEYMYHFDIRVPAAVRNMSGRDFMLYALTDLAETLKDDRNFSDVPTYNRAVEQKAWGFLYALRQATQPEGRAEQPDDAEYRRLESLFRAVESEPRNG